MGKSKVLDFGLAKAAEERPAASAASPTTSPTRSLAMTQAETILVAANMSPEQARGEAVDKRADIWRSVWCWCGCALFAACLAKDPRQRLRDIGDWNSRPAIPPRHPHRRAPQATCIDSVRRGGARWKL